MYTYNDKFSKEDNSPKKQQELDEKIKKIFDFLNSTNTETPYYKVIHKQNLKTSIDKCLPLVKTISTNFENYVYLGMGGAILNPMMAYSTPSKFPNKKVYFINTTDPTRFAFVRKNINLTKTAFIIISSSGETCETLSLLGVTINEFKKANLDFSKNIFICAGPGSNSLQKFANEYNIPKVDYDLDVGGRFSCFSNAFILPAMLAGIDLEAFSGGANKVVEDFWKNKVDSKPVKSALSMYEAQKPNVVTISYNHSLDSYLEWYCQIISESLGKNNQGFTPLRGIGPQEQHSMMQLYLGGPKDKLYTLIYVADTKENKSIAIADKVFGGHFLETKPLGVIHKALYEATSYTLRNQPLRTLELDKLDEENLGSLIMYSSIEIIFLGLLMDMDPFNQPGVEAIKIETVKILAA